LKQNKNNKMDSSMGFLNKALPVKQDKPKGQHITRGMAAEKGKGSGRSSGRIENKTQKL
jgi:hypothetical protein